CMADALINAGHAEASGLRTVSHVTLDSPEGDERRFVAAVEQRTGIKSDVLGVEAHAANTETRLSWITPSAPSGVRIASARHIHESGGRVVLTGRVGDVTMGCTPNNSVAVFEDLAALHFGLALANLRAWSRACRLPFIEVVGGLVRHAARHERPIR